MVVSLENTKGNSSELALLPLVRTQKDLAYLPRFVVHALSTNSREPLGTCCCLCLKHFPLSYLTLPSPLITLTVFRLWLDVTSEKPSMAFQTLLSVPEALCADTLADLRAVIQLPIFLPTSPDPW